MAGLRNETPAPESIVLHGQSRVLEIGFADGSVFRIPFELMRIYSPSAEVQGHGPGQEELKAMMKKSGFGHVDYHNLTAGVAPLHVAIKC